MYLIYAFNLSIFHATGRALALSVDPFPPLDLLAFFSLSLFSTLPLWPPSQPRNTPPLPAAPSRFGDDLFSPFRAPQTRTRAGNYPLVHRRAFHVPFSGPPRRPALRSRSTLFCFVLFCLQTPALHQPRQAAGGRASFAGVPRTRESRTTHARQGSEFAWSDRVSFRAQSLAAKSQVCLRVWN